MTKEKNIQNIPDGVAPFVFEVIKVFVLAAAIIIPIRLFLFQPFFVHGASMEPNFHNGEYLIVNEVGYKTTKIGFGDKQFVVSSKKALQRNDVVIFRYPKNPKLYFIKRVIGVPGDRVIITNGQVRIINTMHPEGIILDEQYLPNHLTTNGDIDVIVNNGEYFVMGDNRHFSSDSRIWGKLPQELVIGKVLIRAWPFTKFAIFS